MSLSRWIRFIHFGFIWGYLAVGIWTGCSNVSFEESPTVACLGFDQPCIVETNGSRRFNVFDYKVSVPKPKVDILFVDDNSKSMYVEQQRMADRFSNFIDSLSGLDWQIAITLTDVTESGGALIEFSPGLTVLKNSTPNAEGLFAGAIKRPEIGSGDERAIYAANLVVQNSSRNQFFRPGAHLAIVILSDEDERSTGGTTRGYPLEPLDQAETLLSKIKSVLGPDKTTSVHSIIIRPGDTQCLAQQTDQENEGRYGTLYAKLSDLTRGVVGNICAADYGAQLSQIGQEIQKNVNSLKLACQPVLEEGHEPVIEMTPATTPPTTARIEAGQAYFSESLSPGTQIHLRYKCEI